MRYTVKAAIFVMTLTFVSFLADAEPVFDDSKSTAYLYVISAKSGSMDGDTLTLNGVPNVVYFSDRPARVAGHKSLDDFFGSMNNQNDDSGLISSNAALSILKDGGSEYLVIEILNAELKDDSISFKVKKLRGNVPSTFNEAALFIDPVQETFPGVY